MAPAPWLTPLLLLPPSLCSWDFSGQWVAFLSGSATIHLGSQYTFPLLNLSLPRIFIPLFLLLAFESSLLQHWEAAEPKTPMKDKSALAGCPGGYESHQGDSALPVAGAAWTTPEKRKFLETDEKIEVSTQHEQTSFSTQKLKNWRNLGRSITGQKCASVAQKQETAIVSKHGSARFVSSAIRLFNTGKPTDFSKSCSLKWQKHLGSNTQNRQPQ